MKTTRKTISRILSMPKHEPVIYLRVTLLHRFSCLPLINGRAALN